MKHKCLVLLAPLGMAFGAQAASYSGVMNQIHAISVPNQPSIIRYEDSAFGVPGALLWTSNTAMNQTMSALFFCKATIVFTFTPAICPGSFQVPGKQCGIITSFSGNCF